ncbi:Uncharacterized protein HZ326_29878 [Fusarium oxysporum f. sp. albedinis]|nr:Uncharacterized protein HZ326_29878 [Fusarium oxysporum f. sp. albedinis]
MPPIVAGGRGPNNIASYIELHCHVDNSIKKALPPVNPTPEGLPIRLPLGLKDKAVHKNSIKEKGPR